jgi:hypothetical protein
MTDHDREGRAMRFDRQEILDLLARQGRTEERRRAQRELPARADTEDPAHVSRRDGMAATAGTSHGHSSRRG